MKKLDTLVFDEADQLLEMGFRPAIENILRRLPSKVTYSSIRRSRTVAILPNV